MAGIDNDEAILPDDHRIGGKRVAHRRMHPVAHLKQALLHQLGPAAQLLRRVAHRLVPGNRSLGDAQQAP